MFEFYQILIKNIKIHVEQIQGRHFIGEKTKLRAAPQPSEGLAKLKNILDMHFANIVVLLSTICIFYKIQVHEV
jgi:uncharacterized protein with PQ loop repeat